MPRTVKDTNVSRDPALVALLATLPAYPGPAAILDAGDRAWLRSQGVPVGDRPEPISLTEAARRARKEKRQGSRTRA